MYLAMKFEPIEFTNNVLPVAVRTKPFKSFEAAKAALFKSMREGYILEQGITRPIFHNLKVN